jgi:phosphatidylglycerophosphate synthase
MEIKYSMDEIKKTQKKTDAWWTVLVIDKIAMRLLWLIANYTKITPNQITVMGFLFSILAAFCFFQGQHVYLIIGAFLFELGFVFDCMDGKLARLKNLKSDFGKYLDGVFDRWKIIFGLLGLAFGQYFIANDNMYLMLGFVYALIAAIGMFYLGEIEDLILNKYKSKQENQENKKPDNLFLKLKYFFESRGLFFGLSSVEIHTTVFSFFTILNQVKIGLIVGILIILPLLLFRMYRFLLRVRREEISLKQKSL